MEKIKRVIKIIYGIISILIAVFCIFVAVSGHIKPALMIAGGTIGCPWIVFLCISVFEEFKESIIMVGFLPIPAILLPILVGIVLCVYLTRNGISSLIG